MFLNNNAFRVTAFIFFIVVSLIALIQPPLFFTPNGTIKGFSFYYSDQTTPLTFGIFLYSFLVLLYILIIFVDGRIVDFLLGLQKSSPSIKT